MTNSILKKTNSSIERPAIIAFADPVDFISAMIRYLKQVEPSFSVLQETKALRRISPALISLLLTRKRNLNYDRVDEIGKLLRLSSYEKFHLKEMVVNKGPKSKKQIDIADIHKKIERRRKEVSVHLLNDWINVYVKDCFQFPEFQAQPELVFKHLELLAKPKRIKKSIAFLLKHGYLRKSLDGRIVVESNLTITESPLPSKKIRAFHKKAMRHAERALELFPIQERMANTFLMPLNEERYQELLKIIKEFNEKTMVIADQEEDVNSRLYQLVLNLSPVGGKIR